RIENERNICPPARSETGYSEEGCVASSVKEAAYSEKIRWPRSHFTLIHPNVCPVTPGFLTNLPSLLCRIGEIHRERQSNIRHDRKRMDRECRASNLNSLLPCALKMKGLTAPLKADLSCRRK